MNRASLLLLLLVGPACRTGRSAPPPVPEPPSGVAVRPPLQDLGGVGMGSEVAYKLWLSHRRGGDRQAVEALETPGEAGLTLIDAAPPWLEGVQLVHAEGSYDGGHAFFEPAWLWEEGRERWVVEPHLEAQPLGEDGRTTRSTALYGCGVDATRQRAALFTEEGDFAGEFAELEDYRAELARILRESCVDLAPRMLTSWRDAHPGADAAAVAELVSLWVRLASGGEPYAPLDGEGAALGGDEVRWWREVALSDPTVRREAGVMRAQGFGTVRQPVGSRQILRHDLELTDDTAILTVESVGTTIVTIE